MTIIITTVIFIATTTIIFNGVALPWSFSRVR
jgi:hypothetical protein